MYMLPLGGTWKMSGFDMSDVEGMVPGSVYSFLFNSGLIDDPYYRDNEISALRLMENDYTFSRSFTVDAELLEYPEVLLCCDGLDTCCELFINDSSIGSAHNMHRVWEYSIKNVLKTGENTISIHFSSPTRYIRERDEEWHVGGSEDAMRGFPHMRKAHCMFGWDWGIRLPDAGIWRDINIRGLRSRISSPYIIQRHENGRLSIKIDVPAKCYDGQSYDICLSITAPDGKTVTVKNKEFFEIEKPQLWWPNGLGNQPLYTIRAELTGHHGIEDVYEKRIGLREMTVAREHDIHGESFSHKVNGVTFFAMGADYIPEDCILSRVTPKRTRKLLERCADANFNVIRVWGGGYYPDDWFYDACDELGLVVWQDFMFACANYPLDFDFEENIAAEARDNIRRLRHHASLGLWCGNNEMEMFQCGGVYDGDNITRAHYIRMFEHILPHILREEDPDTFYWPASPSSGGSFDEPNAADRGDVHYWDVWHGDKPFTEYRKFKFRYVSEFGFQSFPPMRTIESFTEPGDRNVFSRVMETHQRNAGANGKILGYLSKTFLYPSNLETLVYASQLLQAEAIRYGVEHWRRNRGCCMGAVYWQLNDNWPVASWSAIDYYGRLKALYYYSKRFFAPLMISCEETGEKPVISEPSEVSATARLCVTNETLEAVNGIVRWTLRNALSEILTDGEIEPSVPELSSVWLDTTDFSDTDLLKNHLAYEFVVDGTVVSSGTVLFTPPKYYKFVNPELDYKINGDIITVTAKAFAKSVEIYSDDCDIVLSDNFFDMERGSVDIRVSEGNPISLKLRSVYDIGCDVK